MSDFYSNDNDDYTPPVDNTPGFMDEPFAIDQADYDDFLDDDTDLYQGNQNQNSNQNQNQFDPHTNTPSNNKGFFKEGNGGNAKKGSPLGLDNVPDPFGDVDPNDDEILGADAATNKFKADANFYELDYWRPLFDVSTANVLNRILRSVLLFKTDFFRLSQRNPDLYGPLWICMTLVFAVSVTGNLGTYFTFVIRGQGTVFVSNYLSLVYGAAMMFGYLFLVPIVLYFCLKYWNMKLRLVQLICLYGYALFLFIPAALVCMIPVVWVQVVAVGVAWLISGAFLVVNFFGPFRQKLKLADGGPRRIPLYIIVLVGIAVLHAALATGFMFTFFNYEKAPALQVLPVFGSLYPHAGGPPITAPPATPSSPGTPSGYNTSGTPSPPQLLRVFGQ